MASPAFTRPNLVDRLYLLMDGLGAPAQIFYVLDLAERLQPEVLRSALVRTLTELPQLRTTVVRHWHGYRRRPLALTAVDAASLVTVDREPEAVRRFLQVKPDLAQVPPIRLLLHQGPDQDQLALAMHHSITDGQGALHALERLGLNYGACLAGDPPPATAVAMAENRYRQHWWALPWPDRWQAIRNAAAYVRDGASLPGAKPKPRLATFIDQPLPAQGELRYVRHSLSFDRAAQLMRWAVKRKGSPADVLLTAALQAAVTVWPDQAKLPIVVSLPVSIRPPGNTDVANRVCALDMPVQPGDFDHVFAQIAAGSARARTQKPAVMQILSRAVASRMPPWLFERLASRYLLGTENVRESLTFTAMGTFERGPQAFGPVDVSDSVLLGSLIAPPGLKVHVTPHGGRLNICVAYLDPVISPASIAAFGQALLAELERIAP
jgi:hypothetical protein